MKFPEPELGVSVKNYIAQELKKYLASERILSGRGVLIKQTTGGRTLSVAPADSTFEHPLQVYIEAEVLCVRAGHHIWWNSYTSAAAVTDLNKGVGDAWTTYISGERTVYVQRAYNSDGTATVTLEHTTDTYEDVVDGITNIVARWILATIDDGVVTQWWTGGDIHELRVA